MALKAGTRLFAQNSPCEVIVIRSADSVDAVSCGGLAMRPEASGAADPATDGPRVELGKRYVADDGGVEILCTRAGTGPLEVGGQALHLKEAKPLPASD